MTSDKSLNDLENDLNVLNIEISNLEMQITDAERRAEENVEPLRQELSQVKRDKTAYASKNDFDSVSDCIRREENLKFKISAQWNEASQLKDDLFKLKSRKKELEYKLQLERDKIRRNNQVIAQMNIVLDNYRKSQSLKQAAIEANINPDTVEQWHEWGKNSFNETSTYFYNKIIEIDNEFKEREARELKDQMDRVIEAYRKTKSLEKSSKMAKVSHDTVMYWHEWGSRGFGEENTYFYRKIREIK